MIIFCTFEVPSRYSIPRAKPLAHPFQGGPLWKIVLWHPPPRIYLRSAVTYPPLFWQGLYISLGHLLKLVGIGCCFQLTTPYKKAVGLSAPRLFRKILYVMHPWSLWEWAHGCLLFLYTGLIPCMELSHHHWHNELIKPNPKYLSLLFMINKPLSNVNYNVKPHSPVKPK